MEHHALAGVAQQGVGAHQVPRVATTPHNAFGPHKPSHARVRGAHFEPVHHGLSILGLDKKAAHARRMPEL